MIFFASPDAAVYNSSMPFDPWKQKIQGLKSPTEIPSNPEQSKQWQLQNRTWWENNPMRYDWNEPLPYAEGTREYYAEIDRRFFGAISSAMPWKVSPFEQLLPGPRLAHCDVLEIGTGFGSHAALIAPQCKSFTGIDLTDRACRFAAQRLSLSGIKSSIVRMDAENMAFPEESFDFIWSWGVIHLSANPLKILSEIHRVLRPSGQAVLMVYHRSFWTYHLRGALRGIFKGLFLQGFDLNRAVQSGSDGAIARFYTRKEWANLCGALTVNSTEIFGAKVELFPFPAGPFKNALMRLMPDSLGRFFLNKLGWGSFLVSRLQKKQ
jgi:SAM-dependent methyltransferase